MPRVTRVLSFAGYPLLAVTVLAAGYLLWLRWDAYRDHRAGLDARHGELIAASHATLEAAPGLEAERVRLGSDSGLAVTIRVLRPAEPAGPLPVLLLLGGHNTGSDAVRFFDDVGQRAIVALDYPYDGSVSTGGVLETLGALGAVRKAFYDAAPAIWLTLDWLENQPWTEMQEVVMVGVSLGVPFAATAAARDARITALMLVHGAPDNRDWIAKNVRRRVDFGILHGAIASVLNWVVYGPLHDTAEHVAAMAPRPVLIVGARQDERAPPGATEALFDAAREPKTLRWTEGAHVQPSRPDIIEELMRIAEQEL